MLVEAWRSLRIGARRLGPQLYRAGQLLKAKHDVPPLRVAAIDFEFGKKTPAKACKVVPNEVGLVCAERNLQGRYIPYSVWQSRVQQPPRAVKARRRRLFPTSKVSSVHPLLDVFRPPGTVFDEIWERTQDTVLLAHSASVEQNVLQSLAPDGHPMLDLPILCTLRLSVRIVPRLPSYKLFPLTRALACQQPVHLRAHRALDDAYMTYMLFENLMTILKKKYGIDTPTLEFLLTLQETAIGDVKQLLKDTAKGIEREPTKRKPALK